MRLVLLGAPGSGKGTQANLLKIEYGCVHISTGDILRRNLKEETELGLRAGAFMNKGELVPDDLVITMVRERLSQDDLAAGFLMDGFPRTLPQAESFETILQEIDRPLDQVLLLRVDEELLVRRLTDRRTCRSCGKIWNLLTMDPSQAKACPKCGGELYQREDDSEFVIRNRLRVYREQTSPLVSWYEEKGLLSVVDASGSPEETFKRVRVALS